MAHEKDTKALANRFSRTGKNPTAKSRIISDKTTSWRPVSYTHLMIQTSEAVKLFEKYGMEDKTKLFKYRRSSYVNIYNLDGFEDYFYGYMAPSTGMLGVFDLFLYDEGFVDVYKRQALSL